MSIINNLPKSVTFHTSIEGISEYSLPNGLRILLAADESKSSTTVNMTYLVGSRHENQGQTGMAHLLEHMIFRGTTEIRNALAEFSKRGIQANGTTNPDRTNYYGSFAASEETLQWYLHWQFLSMRQANLDEEELKKEIQVVLNEMDRNQNNPFSVLMDRIRTVTYQWHNYGHSTIGARSNVENISAAQLRQFYDLYYQPDNAVLTITGQFDPEKTLSYVANLFSQLPKPQTVRPLVGTQEPTQDGERSVTIRRQGGVPIIANAYHIPPSTSPDFTALDLAQMILSDSPSGVLYQGLVQTELAGAVFGYSPHSYDPGLVFFGAQLENDEKIEEVSKILNDSLELDVEKSITQEQLDRAKNQWLGQWQELYASPEQLGILLSEVIALGDWRLFFYERDRLESIGLDDVIAAAKHYLMRSNRTTAIYLPEENAQRRADYPSVDLNQMLADYQGNTSFTAAFAFDSSPNNIQALTRHESIDLANGKINIALLSKPTRSERVHIQYRLNMGSSQDLNGKASIINACASLLDKGTPSINRQHIQDQIEAAFGDIEYSSDRNHLKVSVSGTRQSINELLVLSLHLIREAHFPEAELQEYKKQVVSSIKQSMDDPNVIAGHAIARYYNSWPKDDIRYTPSFEESIAQIQALKAQDLHDFKNQFYGAGLIELAAVGDFDADSLWQCFEDIVSQWPKAPKYERISNPLKANKPNDLVFDTPDKSNAIYVMQQNIPMQDNNPDFAAFSLANFMLGGTQTSRLWVRVRSDEGLSYSVNSSFNASALEEKAIWNSYAIVTPENKSKLVAIFEETWNDILNNGFTQEELDDAIASLLNLRRLARAQDHVLVSTWLRYLDIGKDFSWNEKLDQAYQALSLEQVNSAFRKYFNPKELLRVYAGDLSKTI